MAVKNKRLTSNKAAKTSAKNIAWDLSELFSGPTDPAIEQKLSAVMARADAFEKEFRGTISVPGGPDAEHVFDMLRESEAIQQDFTKIAYYAHLLFAADTTPELHRGLVSKMDEAESALRNKTLFADLEWLALSDDDAARVAGHPTLQNYRHYLDSARRFKPHTLSEAEERLMNEKDLTGIAAWQRFFSEFSSATKFKVKVAGKMRELNQSEILALFRHPNRATRQAAWQAFYGKLGEHSDVLSFVYDTRFSDHLISGRLRGYENPMQPRNLANEIDESSVKAMLAAVEQNYPVAHRYWKLKAKLMGLKKLELFDQYAPLFNASEKITYDESRKLVLDALNRFSPLFGETAQRFFDGNWIDADPRAGKRGGAFCASVGPEHHPYILVNYNDDMRDAATVAHEIGHGIHGELSRGQSIVNYFPSLPVAETASVFAEMLVFDSMLERITAPDKRLALICGKLEDSFATVFRQTVLTRFEELVYAARAGGRLSAERIGEMWMKANAPYYGKNVNLTAGYERGWSYIPHFINTPFYCYAYAFGELLVLALYGMYRRAKADGTAEEFKRNYTAMLSAASSKSPADLVAMMGIDIHDASFWQVGFDELARLVSDAERLAGKVKKG